MSNKPGYFDSKRDKTFPCFCEACLVGKPVAEQSLDPRYCQSCYDFLSAEALLLSASKRPKWIPRTPQKLTEAKKTGENRYPIVLPLNKQKEVLLPIKNATSQIYQNLTENRPIPNVGGRPKKDVPAKLIKELSGKGMGIKRIVRELQGQGIFLSAMTIQRVLSGERQSGVLQGWV